ncbi:MAG TPA: hypothetical protein VLL47_04790, partial [Robiginitalea sp.]|nr:hypothetical protein [Robiginitalea sp.]
MKKGMLTLALIFASTLLISNCGKDDWIDCDLCPSSNPWTVAISSVGHPCFKTEDECKEWQTNNSEVAGGCMR